ncbi:hypothetical protein M9H77_31148 [Catharanthus roseus]|uniref:Uncharacterized protein n=1 Tax=Catharanthus roseus TaxID=4058 RepID=A0ACC0A068_CATRO|nr:hypothetical protein M9H77_31148 [Catharanthus roseus]
MENEGKMDYYSYDMKSFLLQHSYSCFCHFCKQTKFCSFVLDLDRNFHQHACTITSMSGRRHTMEFEGQGESIGGKLFLCYGDSSMSFSSNLFLFYLVFSFKELKLFLDGMFFLSLILHGHSLFVNVPHQVINLDRTRLLVVQDSFHDSLVLIAHNVEPWNICDSLGDANHRTFGFLGNNFYGFDGSFGDPFEFKLFLNAYAFHEIIVSTLCATFRTCDLCLIHVYLPNCLSFHDSLRNQLLARDAKLEQSCFNLKCWNDEIISLVVDSFPSWTPMWGMIPMFLLVFQNKKKDDFGVLKVSHRVLVETILRKDFLELLLKNFLEKQLCYLKTFIEIPRKDVILDRLLVQNKNSVVISMKHEFSGTLLYHLPFKEFLMKFVCKEEFGKFWDFENNQSYTLFDEFLDFLQKSSWKKGFEKDESFQFRIPFMDCGFKACFETFSTSNQIPYCIFWVYDGSNSFNELERKIIFLSGGHPRKGQLPS